MADDLTPEQQAAVDSYWAAKTPLEQQTAYGRMMELGLPDSYGVNAWGTVVDGVDYTPDMIRALVAQNKLLREHPWKKLEPDGTIRSVVAIPGTELIATSDEEIVDIVVWKDRLICATKKGVFERREDGKFHEIEFVVGCDPATTDEVVAVPSRLTPGEKRTLDTAKRVIAASGYNDAEALAERGITVSDGYHDPIAVVKPLLSDPGRSVDLGVSGFGVHPVGGYGVPHNGCECGTCQDARKSEIPALKPVGSDPAVTLSDNIRSALFSPHPLGELFGMGSAGVPYDDGTDQMPDDHVKTIEALRRVMASAEGDAPEAIFFTCKDGSIKTATMESAFEPCEGCDCGWADIPLSERGFGTDKGE